MYALMYSILYIASIHCYIPLSTATSMSVCSVCIVLWHDHVNGEIKALKKKILHQQFKCGLVRVGSQHTNRYDSITIFQLQAMVG